MPSKKPQCKPLSLGLGSHRHRIGSWSREDKFSLSSEIAIFIILGFEFLLALQISNVPLPKHASRTAIFINKISSETGRYHDLVLRHFPLFILSFPLIHFFIFPYSFFHFPLFIFSPSVSRILCIQCTCIYLVYSTSSSVLVAPCDA